MQFYNLADNPAETKNLIDEEPEKVEALLLLLDEQVSQGRCTPCPQLKNDRDVKFLPVGVNMPRRS